MASWTAYENRNSHLTLVYRDRTRRLAYPCGELRRDTPHKMLVEWVVRQDALRPGDIIKLPAGDTLRLSDGTVLQVPPTVQVSLNFAYA